jgi:DNA polymerase-3 subunit gamma/tau
MSLYLKYRPQELSEVVGNTEVIESLQKTLQEPEKAPHSYLFVGQTGCGKTTLARIIAKELGCDELAYNEINAADNNGVDDVRSIIQKCQFSPLRGKCIVWVIDEAQMLTRQAQNALLKILEDTPSHVYFILCTTDPQKLLPTVKGRCVQYEMNTLDERQMFTLLRKVVKAEEETLEKIVYTQIYKESKGHPRNALQILEKVLSVDEDSRLETAKKSAEHGWTEISRILKGLKTGEPESIRYHILSYCQTMLLNKFDANVAFIMGEFIEPFYDSKFPGLVLACCTVVYRE